MISIASKGAVVEFIGWVRAVDGKVVFGKLASDYFSACPVADATGVRVTYNGFNSWTFEVAPWCIDRLRFQLDADGRPV